jgi:hypothetical protein
MLYTESNTTMTIEIEDFDTKESMKSKIKIYPNDPETIKRQVWIAVGTMLTKMGYIKDGETNG